MTDPTLPQPNAAAVPAADVQAPPPNPATIVHHSYPLRQSEEDANDILVPLRGSTLRRVRKRLVALTTSPFPWSELLLGAATLCFGSSLGALASSLPWADVSSGRAVPTISALIFYIALPLVGAATAVAFVVRRHHVTQHASNLASDLLEELPDPERTK